MTLRDWLRNRWLVEHKSTPREIKELFALAERDLQAAATPRLIADWQIEHLLQRSTSAGNPGAVGRGLSGCEPAES